MFFYIFLFICVIFHLIVVEEVHEDFHDAREDHQDGWGGGDKEVVDVVKWLIFLFFGSWYKLQDGMSGSDLIAWNHDAV